MIIVGLMIGGDPGDVLAIGNQNTVYEEIDETLQEHNIEKVDMDVAVGKFTIKRGEHYSIKGKGNVKQSVVNGTWKLEENYRKIGFFIFKIPVTWNWGLWKKDYGNYEITIPYDADLKELKLDIGAGEVQLWEVKAKSLHVDLGAGDFKGHKMNAVEGKISVGAGKATLNDVVFEDKCNLDVGMGDLDVKNGDFTELKIENGAGSTKIQGKLQGKVVVDNGVGDIKINCEGKKENYAFHIDNGLGTIKINGENYSDQNFSAGAQQLGEFDVDNGVGSITISFE